MSTMSSIVVKKTGTPPEYILHDSLYIQQYSPIAFALKQDGIEGIHDKLLAKLIYDIQMFMEKRLGVTAPMPRKLVRLPCSVFKDFSVGGALYIFFKAAFQRMSPEKWRGFDVMNPSNCDFIYTLLQEVQNSLVDRNFITWPRVHFASSLSDDLIKELENIVRSHNGSVVSDVNAASHLVEWDEEVDGKEIAEDFYRPIETRLNNGVGAVLVHWFYTPDSYDEWLPSQGLECPEVQKPPPTSQHKQWRVCCQFLRDVAKYNEWGNEVDYEVGSALEVDQASVGGMKVGKYRMNPSSTQKKHENTFTEEKKAVMPSLAPPTEDPNFSSSGRAAGNVNVVEVSGNQYTMKEEQPSGQQPPLTAEPDVDRISAEVKHSAEHKQQQDAAPEMEADGTSMEVEEGAGRVPSSESAQENSSAAGPVKRKDRDEDDSESPIQKRKRDLMTTNSPENIAPVLPSWMSMDAISAVERRYLPELFYGASQSSSKNYPDEGTDETVDVRYLRVRNCIIELHNQQPEVYISATECRQKVAGDTALVIRTHEFLDAFGVINTNSSIKPTTRPPKCPAFFFRSPPAAEVESHNTAFKTAATSSGGQESVKTIQWSHQADAALVAAVSALCPEDSKKCDIDWDCVCEAVKRDTDMAVPLSPDICFKRFVEISILCDSGEGSGGTREGVVPKKVKELATLVATECSAYIDCDAASSAVRAVAGVMQEGAGSVLKTAHAVGGGAALVSAAAKLAAGTKESSIEDILDDYLSVRMLALEEKMQVMSSIEKALEIERERVELDRHDLQVQRARIAFIQSHFLQ